MSFRIEYLTDTTQEESVCHAGISRGSTLEDVENEAMAHADQAKAKGATGFQIRQMNAVDEVVAIGDFNPVPLPHRRQHFGASA